MALKVSCGEFYTLEALLKSLIGAPESGDNEGCYGIRIMQQSFLDCTVVACNSTQTHEHLLRRAITLDAKGRPALNVVIVTAAIIDSCSLADKTLLQKFARCFCETTENEVALVLYATADPRD